MPALREAHFGLLSSRRDLRRHSGARCRPRNLSSRERMAHRHAEERSLAPLEMTTHGERGHSTARRQPSYNERLQSASGHEDLIKGRHARDNVQVFRHFVLDWDVDARGGVGISRYFAPHCATRFASRFAGKPPGATSLRRRNSYSRSKTPGESAFG